MTEQTYYFCKGSKQLEEGRPPLNGREQLFASEEEVIDFSTKDRTFASDRIIYRITIERIATVKADVRYSVEKSEGTE